MTPYFVACPALQYLYLEDSYVLGIVEQDPHLIFLIDAVLTEEHPAYVPPPPGIQYCFKRLALRFEDVSNVDWKSMRLRDAHNIDVDGKIDYGNIDSLLFADKTAHIEGSWGEVGLTFSRIVVDYIEP